MPGNLTSGLICYSKNGETETHIFESPEEAMFNITKLFISNPEYITIQAGELIINREALYAFDYDKRLQSE